MSPAQVRCIVRPCTRVVVCMRRGALPRFRPPRLDGPGSLDAATASRLRAGRTPRGPTLLSRSERFGDLCFAARRAPPKVVASDSLGRASPAHARLARPGRRAIRGSIGRRRAGSHRERAGRGSRTARIARTGTTQKNHKVGWQIGCAESESEIPRPASHGRVPAAGPRTSDGRRPGLALGTGGGPGERMTVAALGLMILV